MKLSGTSTGSSRCLTDDGCKRLAATCLHIETGSSSYSGGAPHKPSINGAALAQGDEPFEPLLSPAPPAIPPQPRFVGVDELDELLVLLC